MLIAALLAWLSIAMLWRLTMPADARGRRWNVVHMLLPGIFIAADVSMPLMRACGCGLCRMATCVVPGNVMSAVNFDSPRRSSGSSRRLIADPRIWVAMDMSSLCLRVK